MVMPVGSVLFQLAVPLLQPADMPAGVEVMSWICCESTTGRILRFERSAAFESNNQRSIP